MQILMSANPRHILRSLLLGLLQRPQKGERPQRKERPNSRREQRRQSRPLARAVHPPAGAPPLTRDPAESTPPQQHLPRGKRPPRRDLSHRRKKKNPVPKNSTSCARSGRGPGRTT